MREEVKRIIENEPNFVIWEHQAVHCLIIRQESGKHLCGYIGVESNHPMYLIDYSSIEYNCDIHGGLTYSGFYEKNFPTKDIWWLGFDCAHHMDYSPGYDYDGNYYRNSVYRDISYVTAIVNNMAEDLKNWMFIPQESENEEDSN